MLLIFSILLISYLTVGQILSGTNLEIQHGGVVRTDTTKKEISLVFTGHEFADGGEIILRVLKKHGIKASFFLTGDFYRNRKFSGLIKSLKSNGHYLGAHSDKHLLYCSWEQRDSLLVSESEFKQDLRANYEEMKKFGIAKSAASYFMPPYEWYNDTISAWTRDLEIVLVNYTSGTYSNADWTHPELGKQYLSSDTIYARILHYESQSPHGLNGFLLLTHIGTDPRRTDKFYRRLAGLITELKRRGYRFTRLSETIELRH
jgi:peptidoglycan/xylan/chitin deacetylase (PgdA/CDA1 family)